MSVIQWADQRTQALGIWDIGVLKIYCALFGIIIGAFIPNFVRQNIWWFVIPVVLLGCGLGLRWFTAPDRKTHDG